MCFTLIDITRQVRNLLFISGFYRLPFHLPLLQSILLRYLYYCILRSCPAHFVRQIMLKSNIECDNASKNVKSMFTLIMPAVRHTFNISTVIPKYFSETASPCHSYAMHKAKESILKLIFSLISQLEMVLVSLFKENSAHRQ